MPTSETSARPPEAELLLCCARTHLDSASATRMGALLGQDLDWNHLLHLADAHGMVPLLYRHLQSDYAQAVPAWALEQLHLLSRETARRTLGLSRALQELLTLFETEGIPALPFKGVVLAASVYGNLGLRKAGDLDILIRRHNALRAKDLLLSRGFRLATPVNRRGYPSRAGKYEYRLIHDRDALVVELRWRLTQRHFAALGLEDLWEHRQMVALAGTTVASLPPEYLLLVLCAHGTKHFWTRLTWVMDVAELLRRYPHLDWPRAQELPRRLGLGRTLLLGLHLAGSLLACELPECARTRIAADGEVQTLAAEVSQRLFDGPDAPREPNGTWARRLYHLRVAERPRERIRFCLHLAYRHSIPTQRDRALVRLPACLELVYFLLRPARLVADYGFAQARRLPRSRRRRQQTPADH